jgi:type IV secretion system protein VirD4
MHSIRAPLLQATVALLIVTAALFTTTHWAASMLGNHLALGEPWLHILELKLYAPWKLFVWWVAFDSQAAHVFARAGAVAALGGLASGAVAIGGAAWRTSLNRKPTIYGSARWLPVGRPPTLR